MEVEGYDKDDNKIAIGVELPDGELQGALKALMYKKSGADWVPYEGGGGGGTSYWDRDAVNGEVYPKNIDDKVGIQNNNPQRLLHIGGGDIMGTGNVNIRMDAGTDANGTLEFWSGGGELAKIEADTGNWGELGIHSNMFNGIAFWQGINRYARMNKTLGLQIDKIKEYTTGVGVTIESILFSDAIIGTPSIGMVNSGAILHVNDGENEVRLGDYDGGGYDTRINTDSDYVIFSAGGTPLARFFRDSGVPNSDPQFEVDKIVEYTTGAGVTLSYYTKLGSDAPKIKTKKITGTTTSSTGTAIAHGLSLARILSATVVITTSNMGISPEFTGNVGYKYSFNIEDDNFVFKNTQLNCQNKPFKILVVYEE